MPPHSHNRPAGSKGISLAGFGVLALLLALPVYAGSRFTSEVDWRGLIVAPVLLSTFAFFAYRSDKRAAQAGEWRVPESTLHVVELLGGWPGAFIAQRQFRHKTAKVSYQVMFWMIVFAYQFVAFDSLEEWRLIREAVRQVRELVASNPRQ